MYKYTHGLQMVHVNTHGQGVHTHVGLKLSCTCIIIRTVYSVCFCVIQCSLHNSIHLLHIKTSNISSGPHIAISKGKTPTETIAAIVHAQDSQKASVSAHVHTHVSVFVLLRNVSVFQNNIEQA